MEKMRSTEGERDIGYSRSEDGISFSEKSNTVNDLINAHFQ